MKKRVSLILLLLCIGLAGQALAANVAARPEPRPGPRPGQGQIVCVKNPDMEIPLKQTNVKISIFGFIASVDVEQTFTNPSQEKIEAVYIFPLPGDSAVDDMEIKVGDHVIRGEVKEREAARQSYEQARDAGYNAGLLEQNRPNTFMTSIANIESGKDIIVHIHYNERLTYDDGGFRLSFPMVVAPRYIPGANINGSSINTDRVPDAEQISPPRADNRLGAGIFISVDLNSGIPIKKLNSPSHQVKINKIAPSHYNVELARLDEIPNKDFILEYKVAGEHPEAVIMQAVSKQGNGYFLMMAAPPSDFQSKDVRPKEVTFIIDTSGSMAGPKITQAKNALHACLHGLNPQDEFNIIRFSSDSQPMAPAPMPFTQENVNAADRFIDGLYARGGTEMLGPLLYALQRPQPLNMLRVIVFLTDGEVGNEAQILQLVRQNLGGARIFTFGIDSAVNEIFLKKLAQIGRGTAEFLLPQQQQIETVINRFQSRISAPMLTDLKMDWSQLAATDISPNPLPDLYVNEPIFIVGKMRNSGKQQINLHALSVFGPTTMPILIDSSETNTRYKTLGSLWARARIEQLSDKLIDLPDDAATKDEIVQLAIQHRLASQFTAFVALEEQTEPMPGGKPRTVYVPVPMPDGWEMNQNGVIAKQAIDVDARNLLLTQAGSGGTVAPASPNVSHRHAAARNTSSPGYNVGAANADASRGVAAGVDGGVIGGSSNGVGYGAGSAVATREMPTGAPAPTNKPAPPPTVSPSSHPPSLTEMKPAPKEPQEALKAQPALTPKAKKDAGKLAKSPSYDEADSIADYEVSNLNNEDPALYLVKHQSVNGAWADANNPFNGLRTTSLATLAFISSGNTAHRGGYQPQVRHALEYIAANIDGDGFLKETVGQAGQTETQAIALWTMAESLADSSSATARKATESLLKGLLQLRGANGLWRDRLYGVDSENYTSTLWALMALRSAKNAGLTVDEKLINSAQAAIDASGKFNSNNLVDALIGTLKNEPTLPMSSSAVRYLTSALARNNQAPKP
jgi:Ca-activated chloride channel family protein